MQRLMDVIEYYKEQYSSNLTSNPSGSASIKDFSPRRLLTYDAISGRLLILISMLVSTTFRGENESFLTLFDY